MPKKDNAKMCALARDGKLRKTAKLSSHPRFICKKCCRVADCDSNLCKSKPLDT